MLNLKYLDWDIMIVLKSIQCVNVFHVTSVVLLGFLLQLFYIVSGHVILRCLVTKINMIMC